MHIFYLIQIYQQFLLILDIYDVYKFKTQMTASKPQPSFFDNFSKSAEPFVIGGLSGMFATCIIQPVDMIKVSIQLKSQELSHSHDKSSLSPFSVLREILEKEGVRGFYRGLDSALARQIFYTTTRLGVYKTITQKVKISNAAQGKKDLSFFQKAYCASFAGFVGSIVGNPADLALVRMQADSRLPLEQRRNYKNVFDAFRRIVVDEGFLALWRGATPTIIRAIVLNLAMLSSYDEVKQQIISRFNMQESLQVRLYASLVSGFLSSFVSLPFDNAKTKIQKMKKLPDGTYPYKNIFDAMGKTIKNEGFTKLWVGFPTFYVRISPHVCITLITQDLLTDMVKKWRAAKH